MVVKMAGSISITPPLVDGDLRHFAKPLPPHQFPKNEARKSDRTTPPRKLTVLQLRFTRAWPNASDVRRRPPGPGGYGGEGSRANLGQHGPKPAESAFTKVSSESKKKCKNGC